MLQTNMSDILARIDDQNRLVKQEAGLSAAPAAVVHQLKSMNLPQQLKEMKLPDLPQAIKVTTGCFVFDVSDGVPDTTEPLFTCVYVCMACLRNVRLIISL